MAGPWLKMECATPEKPEVLAITAALGWDDPDLTVGKLFRLWRWFDQQTTDGNAAGVTSALLDRVVGVTGFVSAVASVGWLEADEAGIRLSNFGLHNGETAKQRAQTAKRVAGHKSNAKGNAEGNGASVTKSVPRERVRVDTSTSLRSVDVSGSRQAADPPTPPDPFDGTNAEALNGRHVVELAKFWELPEAWGFDAEALGWKPAEIIVQAEKFRQYWTVGKGAAKRRNVKGWRQCWSNWLEKAAEYRR